MIVGNEYYSYLSKVLLMVVYNLHRVSNFDKYLLVGSSGRKAATSSRPWLVPKLLSTCWNYNFEDSRFSFKSKIWENRNGGPRVTPTPYGVLMSSLRSVFKIFGLLFHRQEKVNAFPAWGHNTNMKIDYLY